MVSSNNSRPQLKVENRKVEGRAVKKLRRDGILPANVFGKKIKSFSVEVPLKNFLAIYEKVGDTGLVDLESGSDVIPVLVSNIQYHPVTDVALHVDFRQVDLKEKIQAPVPIQMAGGPEESPAVKSGIGILVQQMNEIEVEALPTDLPENIIVDVSALVNVDDAIHVKDLKVDHSKVILLTDEDQIVVKIEPPAKEEEVAPTPAPEGEESAAPEGGEVPVEGEAPPTESSEESGEKE